MMSCFSGCGGYIDHFLGIVNITLPTFVIVHDTPYTECDWMLVGETGKRIWIKFLVNDLPEPFSSSSSFGSNCETAYVMFGGYSYKGERLVHAKLCETSVVDIYLTPSNRAWLTFVWTGKNRGMIKRPVRVQVQLTLQQSGIIIMSITSEIFNITISLTILLKLSN